MKRSTYLTIAIVMLSTAIVALLLAVMFDATDDQETSKIFGCSASIIAVPAFLSAFIFFDSNKKGDTESTEPTISEPKDEE